MDAAPQPDHPDDLRDEGVAGADDHSGHRPAGAEEARRVTDIEADTNAEFWDKFYAERTSRWTGNANVLLVDEVAALPRGTALDLGCGQGGDALWLAAEGWQVTAVDIAASALEFGAARAAEAGVSDRIAWERHDLAETFPEGRFDLVSACYLHSWFELPRGEILRAAAEAVSPGGTLLVVGHAGAPAWAEASAHAHVFPTPDDVLADLALEPQQWAVRRSAFVDKPVLDPDGNPSTRPDNVVRVERLT